MVKTGRNGITQVTVRHLVASSHIIQERKHKLCDVEPASMIRNLLKFRHRTVQKELCSRRAKDSAELIGGRFIGALGKLVMVSSNTLH